MLRTLLLIGIIVIALFVRIKRRVGDETRFSRAMADLQVLNSNQPEELPIDPWNKPYAKGVITSGGSEIIYFYSEGPDTQSDTLGHDPDDITPWVSSDSWLDQIHPDRVSLPIIWLAIGALVGSAVTKHTTRIKNAQQVEDGDTSQRSC